MIDFTSTKRPEFIQLVLIIAVVCLALGAITPAASAASYDWDFSVQGSDATAYTLYDTHLNQTDWIPAPAGAPFERWFAQVLDFGDGPYIYINIASVDRNADWETAFKDLLYSCGLIDSDDDIRSMSVSAYNLGRVYIDPKPFPFTFVVPGITYPFHVDVVDSGTDYLISVSGIDGTQLAGSAYTIAVSTFTGGYRLPITSYPMYLGDSPVHFWTSDETFTLPVYLTDGVTPIDYYCVMSFVGDPTYTGYQFWWNQTTSGYLDYPFDTTYPTIIPTPVIPVDIIPDPDSLNNTINITGWYQEQGFENNNITAPIYNGLRGFFTETLIPFYDFFLVPMGSMAMTISDNAETSTESLNYLSDELSIYAAPMSMLGGYVVVLVPDVVWLVVFTALSIGYVFLLIRISTGSIRDSINGFLRR